MFVLWKSTDQEVLNLRNNNLLESGFLNVVKICLLGWKIKYWVNKSMVPVLIVILKKFLAKLTGELCFQRLHDSQSAIYNFLGSQNIWVTESLYVKHGLCRDLQQLKKFFSTIYLLLSKDLILWFFSKILVKVLVDSYEAFNHSHSAGPSCAAIQDQLQTRLVVTVKLVILESWAVYWTNNWSDLFE